MTDSSPFEARLRRALLRLTADDGAEFDAAELARTIVAERRATPWRRLTAGMVSVARASRLAVLVAMLLVALTVGTVLVGSGVVEPSMPGVAPADDTTPSATVPSTPPTTPGASAAVGPNGLIAYCRGELPDTRIHLMEADGTRDRELVVGVAPAWSADGGTLSYITDWPDETKVYVAEGDGSNPRPLPDLGGDGGGQEHALSPDGRSMAWFDRRPRGSDERTGNGSIMGFRHPPLRVTSIDDGLARLVLAGDEVTDPYVTVPVWAPDGRSIAFAGLGEMGTGAYRASVYVVDVATGAVRRVTTRPGTDEVAIAWSPDSRRIAFAALPDGALPPTPTTVGETIQDIFVIDADGTNERDATSMPGPERQPSWSPDGTRLAYLWYDGSAQRAMITTLTGPSDAPSSLMGPAAEQVAWSPDGAMLLYATGKGLATIDAGFDGDPVTLVDDVPTPCATWQPREP